MLKELENNKLITWSFTDHKNEETKMLKDENDNETVQLSVYRFHVRLTFEGAVYAGNYLRLKKQDNLDRQNKNITLGGIVIAGLTGLFIFFTWRTGESTDRQLQQINIQFQQQSLSIHSIEQSQIAIDSSLQTMAKDSVKKIYVLKK